jgi:hypothetical protein
VSPINRAKGALLAVAIAVAGAAWLFGWAQEPCYWVADQLVCEVKR